MGTSPAMTASAIAPAIFRVLRNIGIPDLADQHRNAVHRIAAVSLRIPVAGDVRLHRAARVRRPRPYLVVAVAWQLHGCRPALPVVAVLRLGEIGTLPAG